MKTARSMVSALGIACALLLACSDSQSNGPVGLNPGDNTNPGTNTNPTNPPSGTQDPTTSPTASPTYVPTQADSVGRSGYEDGSAARMALYGVAQYYWGDAGQGEIPLVKISHAISPQAIDLEVTFNPGFVDLTYGTGSIGWNPNRPHTFRDLHISDHVEISVTNGAGEVVFKGRLDLLSATTKSPTGYATLGPFGGDGNVQAGDPTKILSYGTTMDDNINYYGYHLFENSPPTDSNYTRNQEYPNWQYYASYRITFDPSIFGPSGYGEVLMTSVHASPSKTPRETIPVTEKPLPNPGSPSDPFRFYTPSTIIPNVPSTPPDTSSVPPDTTTPPDTSAVPD